MTSGISDYSLQAIRNSDTLALHAAVYAWGAAAMLSGRVLDLGCEYCFGSAIITETNPRLRVVSVDIDFPALDFAGQFYRGHSLTRVNAGAERLPLPAHSFAGIFLINLLHLVDHPAEVISEVKRALAPGGVAVMSIPPEPFFPAGISRRRVLDQVEGELFNVFYTVTYPMEITVSTPPYAGQVFSTNKAGEMWVAVCKKAPSNAGGLESRRHHKAVMEKVRSIVEG